MRNQLLIIIPLVLGMFFTGCSKQNAYLGLIVPIPGEAGISIRNGVLLAVEEANYSGNIRGRKINIILKNEHSDTKEFEDIIEYFDKKEVFSIIGGLHLISPQLDLIDRRNIPCITFTKTPLTHQGSGRMIFRIFNSDALQAAKLAELGCKALSLKSYISVIPVVARTHPSTIYEAKRFAEEFSSAVQVWGSKMISVRKINVDEDFQKYIPVLKQAECIVLLGSVYESSIFCQKIKNLNIPILTWDRLHNNKFIYNGGENVNGIKFIGTSYQQTPSGTDFIKRYNNRFSEPPNQYAIAGYESAKIILEAAKKSNFERQKIASVISGAKELKGVSGTITFDSSGSIIRDMTIIKIKDGEFLSL